MWCEYCERLPVECYDCAQRRSEELRERLREMEERERATQAAEAFKRVSIATHNVKAAALAYYEAREAGDSERIRAKLAVLEDAKEQRSSAIASYRTICPEGTP